MPDPAVPRYGERSLAEVVPSMLAAQGVRGFEADNRLAVEPLDAFCLFVIDGLGQEQLLAHRETAPVMAAAAFGAEPLTTGFPSTTAASLGSLGPGLPPGEHGLVGYTFAVPGHDRPMNALLWELYGIGPHVDLRFEFPPEAFQPHPSALERAAAAGASVVRIGPPPHADSPFTRAVLRGGPYVGAYWDHEILAAVAGGLRAPRASVYAYQPDLDTAGHSRGVGSPEWRAQLERLDRLVADMAAGLRPGQALFVTGDHGMVNLAAEAKVDVGDRPELMEGVRFLGGEARARHVYAAPGAGAEVLATWKESLAGRMWIRSKEESIEEGWFGPVVLDLARARIGDVVAAAFGDVGVFQKAVDPFQFGLRGHHGSMTAAEQLVPLIEFRG